MNKHTPGPWLLRTAPTSAGLCHIVSAADWRSAFIYGDGIRKGFDDALPKAQELAANARLIASAPDLLAFATEWLGSQGSDSNYMTEKARAVIAKATGEQS